MKLQTNITFFGRIDIASKFAKQHSCFYEINYIKYSQIGQPITANTLEK